MNSNQNPNFQYVMPEDEDEEYEEDGGDEIVDMEDDEAQPENNQLVANKVQEEDANQELNLQDENLQPGAKGVGQKPDDNGSYMVNNGAN